MDSDRESGQSTEIHKHALPYWNTRSKPTQVEPGEFLSVITIDLNAYYQPIAQAILELL